MMRRFAAYRIGVGGITGQQESLATASAVILGALGAGTAGLAHPLFAAKLSEHGRFMPDPAQIVFAHVGELKPRDHARFLAWQSRSIRRDGQMNIAPTLHTRFRALVVIVGDDEIDRHS